MSSLMHANKYDTNAVWCDDENTHEIAILGCNEPLEDLSEVTCIACLQAIADYGEKATARLRVVRDVAWEAIRARSTEDSSIGEVYCATCYYAYWHTGAYLPCTKHATPEDKEAIGKHMGNVVLGDHPLLFKNVRSKP